MRRVLCAVREKSQSVNRIIFILFISIILFGLTEYSQADLNKGLVAYYPFNGNADDESGNGNHGSVSGAKLAKDRFGITNSAYRFDENMAAVIVPDSQTLDFASNAPQTISVWINRNAESPIMHILGKRLGCDGGPNGINYQIAFNNNDGCGLGYLYAFCSNKEIVRNAWTHIVVTSNTSESRIYINGKLMVSATSYALGPQNDEPLLIGGSGACGDNFSGLIDDIRIYKRVLSNQEIQDLYYEGQNTPPIITQKRRVDLPSSLFMRPA